MNGDEYCQEEYFNVFCVLFSFCVLCVYVCLFVCPCVGACLCLCVFSVCV